MNTLVLLVAATCTPGADPQPITEIRPYAAPTYVNSGAGVQEWSGTPQESRPRFFSRLRGLFSRRSQTIEAAPASPSGYYQGMPRNGAASFTPNAMIAPPSISTNNSNPTILHSQPAFAPANGPEVQRMPAGQPQPF